MPMLKWQQRYVDSLALLSNEELWEEFLQAQVSDGWDGCFSGRAEWYQECSLRIVEERLASWLEGVEEER